MFLIGFVKDKIGAKFDSREGEIRGVESKVRIHKVVGEEGRERRVVLSMS